MKKIYAILGLASIVAVATAAAPVSLDGRINLKDLVKIKAQSEKNVEVKSVSNQTVIPLRAQAPMNSSVEHKSVILYEDFSKVPDGATETIGKIGDRYADYVASRYYEPGRYIDNDYTPESGTWEGDFVMAGIGGSVVLQSYNPQIGASLSTPLGDYSGDITVTLRARSCPVFWGANNDLGYVTTDGSDLNVIASIHGYDSNDRAVTDMGSYSQMSTGQLYSKEGWQEITFKFRNENANADGYLTFFTSGSIEIDWIKITDDNTYLPCPVVNAPTAFKNDGFTINWDPVRRSYNYYIDLWKTVYTADSGIDEKADFESETLPEWLAGPQVEYAEGEGADGSNAVAIVADGESCGLTMADMGMKLGSFTTKVKFQCDDLETREEPIYLMYDVLGDNGWEPFGYLVCDGWFTMPGYYYEVVVDGEDFEDMYKAVRVYTIGTTENSKVFIDDMAVWSKRPFVLERVEGEHGAIYDPDDDDYNYNYYVYTEYKDPCSFTFEGLDPDTEYWYRVRSHNVREFSIGEKHHAFGVAAPELTPATNVAAGSYTANWTDAPKAQKYIVSNYTAEKVEKADKEFSILLDTFAACDGESEGSLMTPINNTSECFLDDYTDLKGWSGKNNCYGYKMIGGLDNSGSYLVSPEIMANPARGSLFVYIEALGYPGDNLYISCQKNGQTGYVAFDDEGGISGWIEFADAMEGERIRFSSYYGMRFAITAFEAVQAVEPGDMVRRFDSCAEVPAGVQAYTFSNLEGECYAYSVMSVFELEGETALSVSDKFVAVDMKTGASEITSDVDAVAGEPEELVRFSIDGSRVDKGYKGVVIVKMNDGSVSKRIER